MIVCVLIPRFALLAALGGDREALLRPVALAPEAGARGALGTVSGAAEAFGVRAGMPLAESLARCPELALATPDPDRTESAWDQMLRRLEGLGAAVESSLPGEAFLEADGLEGLWGGNLEGVIGRVRRALGIPARIGAASVRFAAYAAATGARGGTRRSVIVPSGAERAFLAPLPVDLLQDRLDADVWGDLERLGVGTLGELAALPRGDVADRFGSIGLRAHELARGRDSPLRPRRVPDEVVESLELPESASGAHLAHALSVLIGRLLARPARRGRSFRGLRITVRLAAGGGWRSDVVLRRAGASAEQLRLALLPKLAELPGPATRLELRALALGPPGRDQPSLSRSSTERRRQLLAEAVRQARAAAGRDAVLRVLEVDPDSRVPERRVMLTPFPA